jgi:broad specificity phosphatase PhoE
MSATTIYFVRHGSVENPHNIFYGTLPSFGLSVEGLLQARALQSFFSDKPVSRIISSQLLRARQTAREIAKFFNSIPISTSSYLYESKTPFDGHPISDMEERHWDIYSGTQPPYEQPGDVFSRAVKFVRKTVRENPEKQIIAVTHADLIVFLSLWAHGCEVSYHNKFLIERKKIDIPFPANASVSTFTFQEDKPLPDFSYYKNDGR